MANTITIAPVYGTGGSKLLVLAVNIISDGSQESTTILYNNSTYVNNAKKGRLMGVQASGSSCICRLSWDQTTAFPIVSFNPQSTFQIDWNSFNGIYNPGAAGATGNIILHTTGLTNTSEVNMFLYIKQI